MNRSTQLFGGKPVMIFRHEHDRRNFLRSAGLVGVGAAFATRLASDPVAFAQGSTSDLDILNYALTLEYLESDFYMQGIAGGTLSGRELELITPIGDHEKAHVSAITDTINTLGGMPVAKPMFTFPEGTFTDRMKFLMTAHTFEELGVDAYHGQVANIQSGDILGAAAAIAGSESRHAAVLANLTGQNPFPAPFEDSKTMEQVLAAAMPFLGGGS